MHLLFFALLTILAGTLLLAKTMKEELGKFFLLISRFFIIVGFTLFVLFVVGGIFRMAHHGKPGRPGFRHEMMMRHMRPGMHEGMAVPPGMHEGMTCPPGMCNGACGKMEMKKDSVKK